MKKVPSKYSFLPADAVSCLKIFCLLLSLRHIFVLTLVSIYFGSVDAYMNGSCKFAHFVKS